MAKSNTKTANKATAKKGSKPVAETAASHRPIHGKSAGFNVVTTVHVLPSKLVHEPKFLGRTTKLGEEEIVALADSIRLNGQEQPCQVRAIEGTDKYTIIFGNTRGFAGQLIETGYKSGDKDISSIPDFKLRCEVVDVTDEEAFVNNIVEQAHRNQCSPIDNARNQETLRKPEAEGGHGMSDNAIARLYGWSGSAFVNRLKKLLTLPEYY